MNVTLEAKLASLPDLNRAQLLVLWREHLPEEPPPPLRKELLVPILAYKMQERVYGGLSHSARRRLREIAQSLAPEKRAHPSLAPGLKTGTRLVRSWQGRVHEVTVSDGGFEYCGRVFDNLSTIAREITGTRWSGPLFFGTKKKAS